MGWKSKTMNYDEAVHQQFLKASRQRYCEISRQIDQDSALRLCKPVIKHTLNHVWPHDTWPCVVKPPPSECNWFRSTLDTKATVCMFNNFTGTKSCPRKTDEICDSTAKGKTCCLQNHCG